jgi:hypothetical protein
LYNSLHQNNFISIKGDSKTANPGFGPFFLGMSAFTQTIQGSKPVMIDLGQASGVTITKVTLLNPNEAKNVKVSFSYLPLPTGEEDEDEKPVRKSEVIAEFKDGKTSIEVDSIATDEMEPSVFTTDGAKVKIEGIFMADDYFNEEELEEDGENAYQYSDDE